MSTTSPLSDMIDRISNPGFPFTMYYVGTKPLWKTATMHLLAPITSAALMLLEVGTAVVLVRGIMVSLAEDMAQANNELCWIIGLLFAYEVSMIAGAKLFNKILMYPMIINGLLAIGMTLDTIREYVFYTTRFMAFEPGCADEWSRLFLHHQMSNNGIYIDVLRRTGFLVTNGAVLRISDVVLEDNNRGATEIQLCFSTADPRGNKFTVNKLFAAYRRAPNKALTNVEAIRKALTVVVIKTTETS